MARSIALVLLVANILYFGWSLLIDGDSEKLRAVATTASVPKPVPATPAPPAACATLGPYADEFAAVTAQGQLEKIGYGVMRRDATQQVSDGYWVYVGDLKDVADQNRVLRAIKRARIQDAFAMPDDPTFRVSVGIFSDRTRAEDRAARVRALRLAAQVTERTRDDTAIWLDLPGISAATVGDGRLVTAGFAVDGLRIEACP
jgi:cell division septation protein DedD